MTDSRAVLVIAGSLACCGCLGGQSGTDAGDTECLSARSILLASSATRNHLRNGLRTLEGTWANERQASQLTFELEVGERIPEVDDNACFSRVQYQVEARVRTQDGLVDARTSLLEFDLAGTGRLQFPITGLPDAYLSPPPQDGAFIDGEALRAWRDLPLEPTLLVELFPDHLKRTEELTIHANLLVLVRAIQSSVGRWSSIFQEVPPRAVPAYVVPPAFADACANAKPYTGGAAQVPSTFSSAAEVSETLLGTWIRCVDVEPPPHVGLQISGDGRWRRLVQNGDGLATREGFLNEGTVSIVDVWGDKAPGLFQVNLFGARVGMFASLMGDQLVAGPAVYVKSSLLVETVSSPYSSRERGGEEACSGPEEGILDLSPGELNSVLLGDWTLCSGALPDGRVRLKFDGQGRASYFDQQGNELGSHGYTVMELESDPPVRPRDLLLALDGEPAVEVIVSERPLKLWLRTETLDRGPFTAVFSAVP